MFLSKKKEVIGVDVGSGSIKVVGLKEQKGTYALQSIGIMPLPPEAIVDNTLMDTSAVVEGVRNLLKSLAIKNSDVASSVSGNSIIIRKIQIPLMTQEELDDQIQWEAEQYIPFDINDVHIDFQILGSDETDPTKMSVLLAASKKDIVNDYISVFSEAGLKLAVMDVTAFALQNAFELNYDPEPAEVSALINIGASIMNINIVKAGSSLFTRDVQLGGNLYTEEIQKQLAVDAAEAEHIKLSHETDNAGRLEAIFSRINDTVAMEVRRALDFYNSAAPDGKIDKVFLSGGCAKTPSLVDVIGERLGLPVEIINPFQKIICNDKEFDPDYLQEMGPVVTVAVGLALRRFGDK
ncbi:type IV pilus biogenesis protein PilM [Geobacter sp. DSM 9736]|uniref:type IV pilus biogenesis protein PilM n=1 Tax=Geobacter sp. DSM 9736 TaxID=1277350 RepID=UPI000B50599F|nr:type IV pilus assembly protein PilM [Geobacter sp. DSM 9736]SNB46192.1 type IV pilus assembly protein PilM [Geobacter sp. DSM 9736]